MNTAQPGLASDMSCILAFIEHRSPLDEARRIADAACWSNAQSKPLRDLIAQDDDGAVVARQLTAALRAPNADSEILAARRFG